MKKILIFILIVVFISTEVFAAGGSLIFSDTFTDSNDTSLENHKPEIGTGWTEAYDRNGTDSLDIDTNRLGPGVLDTTTAGSGYVANATYSSPSYQVKYTCVNCGDNDEYVYSLIRAQDTIAQNNGAYVLWDTSDQTTIDPKISRITANGSCATLDIADQGLLENALWPNNVEVVFQAIGSEISAFANNVAHLFAIDTNIIAANKGGGGMGAFPCDTAGDLGGASEDAEQQVDNFSISKIAAYSTSYRAPTTNGEVSNDWLNPSNAYADDGSYAEEDANGGAQDYGDFGFSIPARGIIRGIQIKVEGEVGIIASWVEIGVEVSTDNGATWSSQLLGRYQSSGPDIYLFGHANYLWGLNWAAQDTADTDLRIRLEKNNGESGLASHDLEIDYAAVKIFYDMPAKVRLFGRTIRLKRNIRLHKIESLENFAITLPKNIYGFL